MLQVHSAGKDLYCNDMTSKDDKRLIFERSQPYYLPCSVKERYDNIATQQLLGIDDSEDDVSNFFEHDWLDQKQEERSMNEEKASLGELLYDAVRLEPVKQLKGAISPWETCDSQNDHYKGYIKELLSWKSTAPSAKQPLFSRKHDKRRLCLEKQSVFSHRCSRRCDQFEEKPSEKENFDAHVVHSTREENARGNQNRTTPHNMLKFRRFFNPREFIAYYRDNITYFMIQQHLCNYVNNWQAAKSFRSPRKVEHTRKSGEDKKTQIFRFKISSEKKAFGVLRVGPCPKAGSTKNVALLESSKEEKKIFKSEERQMKEPTRSEAFEMTITGAKPPSTDIQSETNCIQKRLSKAKMPRTTSLPKSSKGDLSNSGEREESYPYFGGNWKEKVKTVELQIVKAATGSRAKGTTKKLNRPKNKVCVII